MLNRFEFERYIQASAKRGDLVVVWIESGCPCTDGKKLYLPFLSAKATLFDYYQMMHTTNHEVWHNLFTDFDAINKRNIDASNSPLGLIHNVLEDHRIEWQGGSEYEGDRANADIVYPDLIEEAIEGQRKLPEQLRNLIVPMTWFLNHANLDLYRTAARMVGELERAATTQEQLDAIEKLRNGDYLDVLRNAREMGDRVAGTEATWQLAKRIFEEVFGGNSEQEEEKRKPKPEKGGSKGGSGGESEGDEEQEGEDKAKPEGGQNGEEDGEPTDSDEVVEVDYRETLPNKPIDRTRTEAPKGRGARTVYRTRGSKTYIPAASSHFIVVDFTRR